MSGINAMTRSQLREKLKALGAVTKEQRNAIVCSFLGHSKIVSCFFGYVSCGRCQAEIGDTLGGATTLESNVLIGHDCEVCRKNWKGLGWQDKLYVPDPFKKDPV